MANTKCTTVGPQIDASTTNVTNIVTLVNDIRAKLKGCYPLSKTTLAIGSSKPNVANAAFDYIINGVQYTKTAVAAGTAPGNDVVPQNKYGAVALDIDSAGTITAVEAPANATGYNTAVLAAAALPAVGANKARMGYVTAMKSDGAFTFATTNLDAANTTVAYTDGTTAFEAIGSAVTEV